MLKNIILVIMVLFAIGCAKPEEEVKFQGVAEENNYVKQGMMHLQEKNVTEAIKNFDQAIKMDPKNPENYLTLGQVYLALKNYTRAIDTLTAATNVAPIMGKAHYLLAVSLRMRNSDGDIPKAIESAKRSVICYKQAKDQKGLAQSLGLFKSLTEGGEPQVPEVDVSAMDGSYTE